MRHICTICGREKTRAGWFLIAENRWEDRLKILDWERSLASIPGFHAVCSAEHAVELAGHWMKTESLSYPYATERVIPRRYAMDRDTDLGEAAILGELFVHRESIGRLLHENPGTLTAVLDELLIALNPENESFKTSQENRPVNFAGQ